MRNNHVVRMVAVALAVVVAALIPLPARAHGDHEPPSPSNADFRAITKYVVSDEPGVMPEGIAIAPDGTMYVTSVGTGAVYRGNVRNPRLRLFLPAGSDGRTQATGIHLDRFGHIFVAGYSTGTLFVYDQFGRLLATRKAPHSDATLNDLAITDNAVYVTDSVNGTLWRATLTGLGVGPLVPWIDAAKFPVPPIFHNGIVTTPDGRFALIVDQGTEVLFRVDLWARTVTQVKLTENFAADGMILEGRTLYGVHNMLNAAGGVDFVVRQYAMSPDLTAGKLAAQSAVAGQEQSPTTIARDGRRLLWVNSQLASPNPHPPFTVTEVPGIT